jgi:hypothetical protein
VRGKERGRTLNDHDIEGELFEDAHKDGSPGQAFYRDSQGLDFWKKMHLPPKYTAEAGSQNEWLWKKSKTKSADCKSNKSGAPSASPAPSISEQPTMGPSSSSMPTPTEDRGKAGKGKAGKGKAGKGKAGSYWCSPTVSPAPSTSAAPSDSAPPSISSEPSVSAMPTPDPENGNTPGGGSDGTPGNGSDNGSGNGDGDSDVQYPGEATCNAIDSQSPPVLSGALAQFDVTLELEYKKGSTGDDDATQDEVVGYLDMLEKPCSLWIAGCEDEAMAYLSATRNLLSRLLQNDEVEYVTFTSNGPNAWAYSGK